MLTFIICALYAQVAFSNPAAQLTDTTVTTTIHMYYYNDVVNSLPSLSGKCVAITGTSSGLGYWTALAAAKKNPECLIMLNRKSASADAVQEEIARKAPNSAVFTVDFNLASLDTVRQAADSVSKLVSKYGGLDILAMNAGVMGQNDTRTGDGYDVMMQINHLSHFMLTKWLMPSMHAAADSGREVRVVTHSSVGRSHDKIAFGGGPIDAKYYMKSPPGSLGGDTFVAELERYHQTKMANLAFSMGMNAKFKLDKRYANFKSVSAAPGISPGTDLDVPHAMEWIKPFMKKYAAPHMLSAPDAACSFIIATFGADVKSGDFYEPERVMSGKPIKVISEGNVLPPVFPRNEIGINDKELCSQEGMDQVWSASEQGLGEKFPIPEPSTIVV